MTSKKEKVAVAPAIEPFTKHSIIELAQTVAHRPLHFIITYIDGLLEQMTLSPKWAVELSALRYFISRYTSAGGFTLPPLYKVFTRESGSKTYPAYGFSVPSVATCPGAGVCRQYCYSSRAWMYAGSVVRQLQNLLYLKFDPSPIIAALSKMRDGSLVRLYVDGDFRSSEDFFFWNNIARDFPQLHFYAYTKSFAELLKFCETTDSAQAHGTYDFAKNFTINLSNGSSNDDLLLTLAERRYPCLRGIYAVVPIVETKAHQVNIEEGEAWLRANNFPGPYVYCEHHKCSECGFKCASRENFTLWTPIR